MRPYRPPRPSGSLAGPGRLHVRHTRLDRPDGMCEVRFFAVAEDGSTIEISTHVAPEYEQAYYEGLAEIREQIAGTGVRVAAADDFRGTRALMARKSRNDGRSPILGRE